MTTSTNGYVLKQDVEVEVRGGALEVQDSRFYKTVSNDTNTFPYKSGESADGVPQFKHVLAYLYPSADPAAAEAVMASEQWSIAADAEGQQFTWSRSGGAGRKVFTAKLPRMSSGLEVWHTGGEAQLVNEAVPGVERENGEFVESEGESEVLLYSRNDRNCFLFKFSGTGKVRISKKLYAMKAVTGAPFWEIDEQGNMIMMEWELVWEADQEGEVSVEVHHGIVSCVKHFTGRNAMSLPELTADFGHFFYQAVLGAVQLNLRKFGPYLGCRCNAILANIDVFKDAWTRDNVFGYEFLSMVDPQGTEPLIRSYLDMMVDLSQYAAPGSNPATGILLHVNPLDTRSYWDDAAPESLLLGGRHFMITGDKAYAEKNIAYYERCAEYVLSLIRPGHVLPLTSGTWDGQGHLKGIEPYYTAECYAGFKRLAMIEEALGRTEQAVKYGEAADRFKAEALKDYKEGGLWHTERGTFINYIDFKPKELASPRLEVWSDGEVQETGHALAEFAHYETIFPIWLGLLDDAEKIRTAFEWIDANYTYATGRAGVTLPPYVQQTFMALLDALIRQKYDIPNADRLFQFICDQAYAGGLPFPEWVWGTYVRTGTLNPTWEFNFYPNTHVGRIWDNAPYFGIVMQHYGLTYSSEGWQIGEPKKLANYPLTEIKGLRHGAAVYDVAWKGQGTKVVGITVDGEKSASGLLSYTEGKHQVEVLLG